VHGDRRSLWEVEDVGRIAGTDDVHTSSVVPVAVGFARGNVVVVVVAAAAVVVVFGDDNQTPEAVEQHGREPRTLVQPARDRLENAIAVTAYRWEPSQSVQSCPLAHASALVGVGAVAHIQPWVSLHRRRSG
jgi:hypothetical protein